MLGVEKKKKQLDVTVCFIAFMISSTCFEYFYAHHQELFSSLLIRKDARTDTHQTVLGFKGFEQNIFFF